MSDFRVIAIEECTYCHGDGYVSHPWWTHYYLAHPDGPLPKREDDVAWFRRQGWPDGEDLPPAESVCTDCEGNGAIRREIPLLEALRQLNIQPQPYIRVAA